MLPDQCQRIFGLRLNSTSIFHIQIFKGAVFECKTNKAFTATPKMALTVYAIASQSLIKHPIPFFYSLSKFFHHEQTCCFRQ